jgi:hypothetical protein
MCKRAHDDSQVIEFYVAPLNELAASPHHRKRLTMDEWLLLAAPKLK